jgi:DNA-binding CsgD family transcriptional regulator
LPRARPAPRAREALQRATRQVDRARTCLRAGPDEALASWPLSERKRQALGFAALSHSNKRIGYELGLRASTVAGHLGRAARKLGAKSRVELVQLACVEGERAGRQERGHEGPA